MKKIMKFIALVLCLSFIVAPVYSANAKQNKDKALVEAYVHKHYKGYKVKYVKTKDLTEKMLTHRKGKKIVYVEIAKSVSKGKYGKEKGKYNIVYNTYVKKGKTVTSYFIYNPKTNYDDDVVAVVDNGLLS